MFAGSDDNLAAQSLKSAAPLLDMAIGIIGMAVPFGLVIGGLRRVDAARVGIVGMLELPASGIIAYFWLGQRLDVSHILGCLFVLAGVTILQYDKPNLQIKPNAAMERHD